MSNNNVYEEAGTTIGDGKHVVPPGVAVEELNGGKKELSSVCPPEVARLLDGKGVRNVYDEMVQAVVEDSKTRTRFGKWKDMEFVMIVDRFADRFAEAGIKLVVCKRKGSSGTLRWLEFIDIDAAGSYVPQFDVSNLSGQVIKTIYTKLEFPYGVAVEEIKRWGRRKKLREKCPHEVAELIQAKDLVEEYNSLVEMIVEHGGVSGKIMGHWKEDKIQEIIRDARPRFEQKGVALFVSRKDEYVSHGQHGGHNEVFRWIEFVNRSEQPNYYPQRDAETRKKDCSIM